MKSILLTLIVLAVVISCCGVIFASADKSAEESTADTSGPLYQKSVLFVGDSICEAACEWGSAEYGKTVGWAGRIMAWNEMTGINKSKSGASISNCRGDNTVLNQLKAQAGNTYDYVILEGGGNDAWDSAPVGTMTEGFEGPFDQTTFAGGLEASFKYAKETYKDAQIGFIVTFQMPSANYGRMSDMSEYFTVAKDICDKWEIPYLDLYFDEDFNKNVMKTSVNENLPDYIHPNSSGYNILAPIINDWMETLGAEDETPVYVYILIAVAVIAVISIISVVAVLIFNKKR